MLSKSKFCVIGLGYVGLPIAVALAKKNNVIGFDLNKTRVNELKRDYDRTNEISNKILSKVSNLFFTNDDKHLNIPETYIITVPTPINANKLPNLNFIKNACKTVGKFLSKGNIVIFESTVYPGCTREVCIPLLEKNSNLKLNKDFFVGYSPERINPGDNKHTLKNISKIISGSNFYAIKKINNIYKKIINADIYIAPSIEVAEAAKVIENVQRDINIALMNELSMIFEKMNLDTKEVIKAAKTKWNFAEYYPGLVGGHCIGVDPYYLTFKSRKLGLDPKIILAGRDINESMVKFVIKKIKFSLKKESILINRSRIGIFGCTFKENVPDIRNSKVFDLIKNLKNLGSDILVYDPFANRDLVYKEINIKLCSMNSMKNKLDVLIIAVPHSIFIKTNILKYNKLFKGPRIVFDIRGVLKPELARKYNYQLSRL
mgnify:CR=1 FL=1|tara:strand:+ start:791 stop:2083 length:1293 start_codon:yes stop_codon:yes gene_type:complete